MGAPLLSSLRPSEGPGRGLHHWEGRRRPRCRLMFPGTQPSELLLRSSRCCSAQGGREPENYCWGTCGASALRPQEAQPFSIAPAFSRSHRAAGQLIEHLPIPESAAVRWELLWAVRGWNELLGTPSATPPATAVSVIRLPYDRLAEAGAHPTALTSPYSPSGGTLSRAKLPVITLPPPATSPPPGPRGSAAGVHRGCREGGRCPSRGRLL